jgi:SAM-dependent methyltransferase
VADWSLPREDLCRRVRAGTGAKDSARERRAEGFRPPRHERIDGRAARWRVRLRALADLQYRSIRRDLERLLPQATGTLADVGAGAQPFRDLVRPDVKYLAIDIEEAETQFGYRTPDTRYFTGSVLPLADGEADTVLCTETLEHVLDPCAFLRELRRILPPAGRLVLTVPFAARWHFVPQDYWRFTPSGLEHLLISAGFCEVRIYPRGGALAVAGYKGLGFVLLLLAGSGRRGAAAALARLAGLLALPAAALAAALGHVGLAFPGIADDTLGYTVLARAAPSPAVGGAGHSAVGGSSGPGSGNGSRAVSEDRGA